MLTLNAPIELRSAAFTLRDDGGFAERIRGGYTLMGSNLTSQSLTHLLHTPPEVLIADGGEGDEFNTTNVFTFRREQQTILNNVMNRVLLSNRFGLTYQDRVYITDVLHKLGIRDDRRFMEEVREFLSETDNSRSLTDYYMEHIGELRTMLALTEQNLRQEAITEIDEAAAYNENRLYLSIMNRLQTGAIYQIMNNMNRNIAGNTLNLTEVQNAEQTYTARQLLLTRFREMAAGEAQQLTYRAENIYEDETRVDVAITDGQMREKITSAVMLEVLRSFDHAISVRSDRNQVTWMNLNNSFYQAADNELTKILVEAQEHKSAVTYTERDLTVLNESERRELDFLRELTGHTERLEQLVTERERYSASEMQIVERAREEQLEQTERETLREREEVQRERTLRENRLEHRVTEPGETLVEEVERINRQNTENLERYREMRRIFTSEMQREHTRSSDRERTMRESLRVLMDQEHIKELLAEEETPAVSPMNRVLERIYRQLPAESVEIFRQLDAQLTGKAPSTGQTPAAEALEQDLVHFVEHAEVSPEMQEQFREAVHRAAAPETESLRLRVAGEMGSRPAGEVRIRRDRGEAEVTFVHRTEPQLTEEDIRETLEEYRRNIQTTTRVTEEAPQVTEVHHQAPQIVNQTVHQMTRAESEEIATLVERGIRRQIGTIASEVYNRLERHLKTEKARRGI